MNTLYTHIFGILAFGLIVFGYLGYRHHRQAGERMKPIICACVVASLVLVGYVIYLLIMSGSANNVSSGVIL
jgi:cell shape-determining protein MreD